MPHSTLTALSKFCLLRLLKRAVDMLIIVPANQVPRMTWARIQIQGRSRSTRNFGRLKIHIRMNKKRGSWENAQFYSEIFLYLSDSDAISTDCPGNEDTYNGRTLVHMDATGGITWSEYRCRPNCAPMLLLGRQSIKKASSRTFSIKSQVHARRFPPKANYSCINIAHRDDTFDDTCQESESYINWSPTRSQSKAQGNNNHEGIQSLAAASRNLLLIRQSLALEFPDLHCEH